MDTEQATRLIRAVLESVASATPDDLERLGLSEIEHIDKLAGMSVDGVFAGPFDRYPQTDRVFIGFPADQNGFEIVLTKSALVYTEEYANYPGGGMWYRPVDGQTHTCPFCGKQHQGDHDERECEYEVSAAYDRYSMGSC